MDEQELARKVVARRLVTPDQLHEAQSYARGGRTLLSVLLDLGYLRPEDAVELSRGAPQPTLVRETLPRNLKLYMALSVAGIVAAIAYFVSTRSTLEIVHVPAVEGPAPAPATDRPMSFAQQLVARANALIATGSQDLPSGDPAVSKKGAADLRSAAALLEQALREDPPLDRTLTIGALVQLGQARALLQEPEAALEAYEHAIRVDPRAPDALLPAARLCLQLKRLEQAHDFASRSYEDGVGAGGESLLLRAEAAIELGRKDEARQDLERLRGFSTFAPRAEELLKRLP